MPSVKINTIQIDLAYYMTRVEKPKELSFRGDSGDGNLNQEINNISKSIRLEGFRKDRPLIVEEGTNKLVCGFLRYFAALRYFKKDNITDQTVYVKYMSFESETDMLRFQMNENTNGHGSALSSNDKQHIVRRLHSLGVVIDAEIGVQLKISLQTITMWTSNYVDAHYRQVVNNRIVLNSESPRMSKEQAEELIGETVTSVKPFEIMPCFSHIPEDTEFLPEVIQIMSRCRNVATADKAKELRQIIQSGILVNYENELELAELQALRTALVAETRF